MVEHAVPPANQFAASYGAGTSFWNQNLVSEGNSNTDLTDHDADWSDVFGSRIGGSNRHFMRSGPESAFSACIAARGDMIHASKAAKSLYPSNRFHGLVGTVTHMLQDSFAPAHSRRASSLRLLADICSSGGAPDACQHGDFGWTGNSGDDVDDNSALAGAAETATTEYLNAMFLSVARARSFDGVEAVFDRWIDCMPLLKDADSAPAVKNRPLELRGVGGLCVDVQNGAINTNYTPVWLYGCNGSSAQRFTVTASNEIRLTDSSGAQKCLDGLSGVDETGLVIMDCNGGASQKWAVRSNGEIRNGRGLCMDARGGAASNGTPVWLYYCNGSPAQNWRPVSSVKGPDFNVDGRTDLLWHHGASGQLSFWSLNGTSILGNPYLNKQWAASSGWRVVATADFNSDRRTDVLWQNGASGSLYVWYMDGPTFLSGAYLPWAVQDSTGWRVVATGDFNYDGKTDILWHHGPTGSLSPWYMDGINITANPSLSWSAADSSGWRVIGAADFNSDNKVDILWHHGASGELSVWYMDGTTVMGDARLNRLLLSSSGWRAVGVADYNYDRKPDVLWQNASTGVLSCWAMNGVSVTGSAQLAWQAGDSSGWAVVSR